MTTNNTPLKNTSTENLVRWGVIALVVMVFLITAVIVGPKIVQGTKATGNAMGEAGDKTARIAGKTVDKTSEVANLAAEKTALATKRLDIGDDLDAYVRSLGPGKQLTKYEIYGPEKAMEHEQDAFENGAWDEATVQEQRKKVNDWLASLDNKEGYALIVYIKDSQEEWEYPFPVLATKTGNTWTFE